MVPKKTLQYSSIYQGHELEMILGCLLGDSNIQKRNNSYRFRVSHTHKQEGYVNWKYDQLKRLSTRNQPPKKTKTVKDGQTYEGREFYLDSHYCYGELFNLFYQLQTVKNPKTGKIVEKYVKVITQEVIDILPIHPMVVAVWFMDDGSCRDDCFAGKIATQGFKKEESQLLCKYLEDCGIPGARVVSHTKASGQYYLTLPATSGTFGYLVDYVEPIVRQIPCMSYKLNDANKP